MIKALVLNTLLIAVTGTLLFSVSAHGQSFEVLFSDNEGSRPRAGLVQGSDGNFYGTTDEGGESNNGTVFKVTASGTLTVLHSFNRITGIQPNAELVEGSDGNFYGTTYAGGASGYGTVFKITSSGTHTLLHSFNNTNGALPYAGLVQGSDGSFYGTTQYGGASDYGTVFKITASGTHTLLHSFNSTNGRYPIAGLVQGSDGNFYGTTSRGGASGYGTVFKITASGTHTLLRSFNSTNGSYPEARLVQGSDGSFYGTTYQGGGSDYGTVFKITASGTHTLLYSFNNTNGSYPYAGLVQGSDGNFYGTTNGGGASGYGTVFKITASGSHTLLYSFNSTNGRYEAGLVQGSDGSFYGTTYYGGVSDNGTVFKITASGTHTLLYSFNSTNGSNPQSGLLQGSDGSFYGTSRDGGASGCGTVFKITSSGIHTLLHSFNSTNGSLPHGLVQSSDGNFYGTTSHGGASGFGTVFKITSSGTHTLLYSFIAQMSGIFPSGGLTRGSDGNFYGTTGFEGVVGYGTVYKITSGGTRTVLHRFNDTNGSYPSAELVLGSDGSFYGTTRSGGGGDGTVYKITSSGIHTLLHSFNSTNGSLPHGLVQGSDGSFYGTTLKGGASGYGTVFKITSSGTHTLLHSFSGSDGRDPQAGLVQGSDGSFYGITRNGGASGLGTVYKITPGGTHTVLHSFDGSTTGPPLGTPTFSSDGNLYGTADPLAVWRLNFYPTRTPTLFAPISSSITTSPINVSFSLPEAAVAGSVKLLFGSTELVLAASQETAGAHSFSFDPANPTASPEIASGSAIADGSYTVTLSYQDALSNTAAQVQSLNVVVDTIAQIPMLSAPVSGSAHKDSVSVSFSLPEAASPGSVKLAFGGTQLTLAASQETVGTHSFTFAPPDPLASPEIASGEPVTNGTYTVTLSYQDALGNDGASVSATSVVIDRDPLLSTEASKGSAVPGAGVVGSGIPAGAVWHRLGVPALSELGQMAVLGEWKVGASRGQGLFYQDSAAGQMTLLAAKGEAVPGVPKAVYSGFKDPLLCPCGAAVWYATLANAPGTTGAVKTSTDAAIFLDEDGPGGDPPVIVARKGAVAADTASAKWASFSSVVVSEGSVGFLGKMVVSASAGVSLASDSGLWLYDRFSESNVMLLREGEVVLGSRVKTISALTTRTKAGGQGRGVISSFGDEQISLRVTLNNGRTAIGVVLYPSSLDFPYESNTDAVGYGTGALWSSFSMPGQTNPTGALCFRGVVKPGTGTATATNNVALFAEDDATWTLTKRYGLKDPAGITGGVFSGFSDPVNESGEVLAFIGSMASNSAAGITSSSNDGVWYDDSTVLKLMAREGAQPPGVVTGARWKSFNTVALPEGRGPIFVATLEVGRAGITTGKDKGVWATDSAGAVKKLIQEGDPIGVSKVASFQVLSTVSGSPAQTRSFNSAGEVVMQVTDTAGGTHLLHVAVP
ncbi:MAG: hypothetical protein JNJ83_07655 [Verrucomicrobiaceae bacterium]|nr:hypothetical protein [Verrucomicrobiaceae bacterium]